MKLIRIFIKTLVPVFLIFAIAVSCSRQDKAQEQPQDEQPTESAPVKPDDALMLHHDYDIKPLYGVYLHESNTTGFTAILEIIPSGNDLSFSLSVKQNNCTGQAEGDIGIGVYTETEYAGFSDNLDCRMEFLFNLTRQSIRLQEVGHCTLHESGCSFNGVYVKRE
ncbi:MAG: hypothetical protein KF845_12850 [Cyclobacteriaceae bacterium]|nr:hypothetical protein [Cyclobacteriaceae bacterium]